MNKQHADYTRWDADQKHPSGVITPTVNNDLVRVLKAILSVGKIEMTELGPKDYPPRGGYRFSIEASVMLDRSHAKSVLSVMNGEDSSALRDKIVKVEEGNAIRG